MDHSVKSGNTYYAPINATELYHWIIIIHV